MNLELFNKLFEDRPSQRKSEWLMFLEFCEAHIKTYKIENPIAVELGTWNNKQKKFYELLLGVRHIGINFRKKRGVPDIYGNTHDAKTMTQLKRMLNGRSINILFIDASHAYEDVKKDYELYSPLCSDIIAIHDIETHRYSRKKEYEVWKFWDELKAQKDYSFISICGKKDHMGIGVIIKR